MAQPCAAASRLEAQARSEKEVMAFESIEGEAEVSIKTKLAGSAASY